MIKVGVTGGIGSGKTLVCSAISAMGYPIYNADSQAKRIVDSSPEVVAAIKNLLGNDIYVDGQLNRKRVSSLVFTDQQLLEKLNGIVHPAVAEHFSNWLLNNNSRSMVVKEAAILFESGAYKGLDKVIVVTAPIEVRIKRIQERDGFDRESIMNRIRNQYPQEELVKMSDYVIENDGVKLILPQIVNVINDILKES